MPGQGCERPRLGPIRGVLHFGTPYLLSPARIDLIGERRDDVSSLFPFYVRFVDGIAR